jgi:septum formation protein
LKLQRLVLASSSPRRIEYLKALGIRFLVAHPQVDERPLPGERAAAHVRRLAVAKAEAVAARHTGRWVLSADTVVVVDGRILGKPRDDAGARRMLRVLSGRWHEVASGMALVKRSAGRELVELSRTRVHFRTLSEAEIRWYVSSGEPADKAGAYAMQGKGGFFVDRIVGSPSNVVGFPFDAFSRLLARAGLSLAR